MIYRKTMESGYITPIIVTKAQKIITRFHLNVLRTVMWPSPKKKGAVTAAEGTREAKHAAQVIMMMTPTWLMPVDAMAGMVRL